ncbi:hypothetical protein BC940DRAFT_286754 [Gongronella butleri]|nr:hypothetical protein BC940DRAFT_286754 [Gongronella butleri]
MDQQTASALKVLQKGAIYGGLGATVGATIAVLRNAPVKPYAVTMGLSAGVYGVTFHAIRESFLMYQRKQNAQFGLSDSQTRDFDDLFSSAMAGASAGGLLSAMYRGRRGVIPGAVMFGLLSVGLEMASISSNKWRQETIMRERLMELAPNEPLPTRRVWDYIEIPAWSPVRKISEEEYEDILDRRLKELEKQVKQIEREMKQAAKQDKTRSEPSAGASS